MSKATRPWRTKFARWTLAAALTVGASGAQALPTVKIERVGSGPTAEGGTVEFKVSSTEDAPAGGLDVVVNVVEEGAQASPPLEPDLPAQMFVAATDTGERTVRIAAGERAAALIVRTTAADGVHENTATSRVDLTIQARATRYTIDANAGATFAQVHDDERAAPVVTLSEETRSLIIEEGEDIVVGVRMSPTSIYPIEHEFTVTASTDHPGAIEGKDYRLAGAGRVRIQPRRDRATIRIGTPDDNRIEGERYEHPKDADGIYFAEGVKLALSQATGGESVAGSAEDSTAEVIIIDNDTAPLSVSATRVNEGEIIYVTVEINQRNSVCEALPEHSVTITPDEETLENGYLVAGPALEPQTVKITQCGVAARLRYPTINTPGAGPNRVAAFSATNLRSKDEGELRLYLTRHSAFATIADTDRASYLRTAPDHGETYAGSPIELDLLGNDIHGGIPIYEMEVSFPTPPANGTIIKSGSTESPRYTYTPNREFNGTENFTYLVRAGEREAVGHVRINVIGGTQPRWAARWSGSSDIAEGSEKIITLQVIDTSFDAAPDWG